MKVPDRVAIGLLFGILSRVLCGQFSKLGSPFMVLFVRVPYYIRDVRGNPNLENKPL